MANTWLDVAEEVSREGRSKAFSVIVQLNRLIVSSSIVHTVPVQVVMIGTSAGAVGTEYNCDLLAEEVAKVGPRLALVSST